MANQSIFDLGKRALGSVVQTEVAGYACPICLELFETTGDSNEANYLTDEHVPPDSIGGKVLCLTCKQCNSVAGGGIDAQLHRESRSHSFLSIDERTRRARLAVDGLTLNVELTWRDCRAHFHVLGDHNNPKVVDLAKETLRNMPSGTELTIRDVVAYNPKHADIAYLKSAYLAAFAWLGYSYILRPSLDRVRTQIKDPHSSILERYRFYPRGTAAFENGFLVFQKPVSCLAARIGDSVVCLPLPDGDDLFYNELARLSSENTPLAWQGCETYRWPSKFECALDLSSTGGGG